MKAIVLSVKDGQAALLLENGTTTYRRMNVSPGERVEISASVIHSHKMVWLSRAVATVLVVAIGLTLYYKNIAVAYSYISVDINPSVEFSLNRMDSVLNVTAENTDGYDIVKQLNHKHVKGMKIEEAIQLFVELLADTSYLQEDGTGYLLFAVSSENNKRSSQLLEQVEQTVSEHESLECLLLPSTIKEREKAAQLGLSTGRYLELVQSEGKPDPEETLVEQYRSIPVQDLVEQDNSSQTQKTQKSEKNSEPEKSVEPENSSEPEKTSKPDNSSESEKTSKSENSPEPESSIKPEVVFKPITSVQPVSSSSTPEPSIKPLNTITPMVTPTSENNLRTSNTPKPRQSEVPVHPDASDKNDTPAKQEKQSETSAKPEQNQPAENQKEPQEQPQGQQNKSAQSETPAKPEQNNPEEVSQQPQEQPKPQQEHDYQRMENKNAQP